MSKSWVVAACELQVNDFKTNKHQLSDVRDVHLSYIWNFPNDGQYLHRNRRGRADALHYLACAQAQSEYVQGRASGETGAHIRADCYTMQEDWLSSVATAAGLRAWHCIVSYAQRKWGWRRDWWGFVTDFIYFRDPRAVFLSRACACAVQASVASKQQGRRRLSWMRGKANVHLWIEYAFVLSEGRSMKNTIVF